MRGKYLLPFVGLVLVLPPVLFGQEDNTGQTFLSRSVANRYQNPLSHGLSLLDPGKFSISHSYNMSYFSSGGKGNMVGLYMNTMNYQFSEPLSLTVHVGYMHQPFASSSSKNVFSNNTILSGFELTYRPKKNVFLKIEYGAIPIQYDPYYRYRYRYGY